MIQDIIDRLSKSDIISSDEKTLNKVNEITGNTFLSSNETVTQIISHAYTLYKMDSFKLPNVDCFEKTGTRNYSELSSLDKEYLITEITKVMNNLQMKKK